MQDTRELARISDLFRSYFWGATLPVVSFAGSGGLGRTASRHGPLSAMPTSTGCMVVELQRQPSLFF